MKQFLIILFTTFIGVANLHGQAECHSIGLGQARVIAIGGLDIRSAPRQASTCIGKATYGTLVNVLTREDEACNEGFLKPVKMSFLAVDAETQDDRLYSRNGCWVKVKHGNQVGYMLDTYLVNLEREASNGLETEKFAFSEKYYLGFPGENCAVNIPASGNLHWYGVFQSRTTRAASIEAIDFSQFYHREENGYQITIASPSRALFFIIGSKKALLSTGPITYFDREADGLYVGNEYDGFQNNAVLEKEYGLKLELPDEDAFEDAWTEKPLSLTRNGKTQILNPPEMNLKGPVNLIWAGELDNDGAPDFLIRYGVNPKVNLLYLSSESKRNELVGVVTAYLVTNCP